MKLKSVVISLLAIATLPAAWFYNAYAIEHKAQPEARAEAAPLPVVSVVTLTPEPARANISALGNVESTTRLTLKTRLSSRVIWKSEQLKAGNRVSEGTLLAKLETTDFALALAQAQQQKAEAELALQQAQEQARQAQRDWQRAGLKNAAASDLLLQKPQLAAARAALHSADARLTQARRDLKECEIRAPFNAVVAASDLSLHSLTNSGDTIATLTASDRAEIAVALAPEQWQLLNLGEPQQAAIVRSTQNRTLQWPAQVTRFAHQLDNTTRLRQVSVTVDKPLDQAAPLLPGSFVRVEFAGRTINGLLALPQSAVSADGYFWSLSDSTLQRHAVVPVFNHQGRIYVRAPGQAPLQVVSKAIASYLPGMKAVAREADNG